MTHPPPGGPDWQPAPGADGPGWEPVPGADRPEWLQPPPGGSGWPPPPTPPGWPAPQQAGRGWSPTPPPPERPRGRRVGPLVATLILLLVVGLAAGGLVFATRREPSPSAGGATAAPATRAPAGQTPSTRAPAATPAGPEVREVQQAVAELRELRFERRVPVTVESPERLARRLLRVMAEETDEDRLRRQGRALELLGQLPAGTDLPSLLSRIQAESVLGFYLPGRQPPKGSLYVRSSAGLDPYTKFNLSHELTHAVTDQHFDLTRADRLADATAREDELAAYSGLVEGDAVLVMQRYLAERLTPSEQAAAALTAAGQGTPRLDAAPAVIRESLIFPYQEGLRFVRILYQQGGWAAVNRAYRDPPTSTEQLLHPERYLRDRDQPQAVAVPDLSGPLGGGWRPATEQSFGEFDARLLLQGELAVATAQSAASGWDGGRLRTFQRGRSTALALRTVWDTTDEATEFCNAMRGWATARFGPATRTSTTLRWSGDNQRTALTCRGPRVAWLSAPDPSTLNRLTTALSSP
ncbi:MAG TPA: hypothetical protein VHO93_04885 [Actinomycetota bacterium]|nr:hypothetical protein [Actinomycetota bacterium]